MLSSVFPRPISEGTPVVVVQGKLFEEIPDNSSDLKERAHGAWSGRPNPRDEKKCCSCSSRRIFYTTLIVIAGLIVLAGLWPLVSYLTISVRPCIHPDASLPFRAPPTMEDKALVSPSLFGNRVAQGMAWNGTNLFFSGTDSVTSTVKEGKHFKILASVDPAVPPELHNEDYWHVGDITYFNHTIVLPVEDRHFKKPALLLLDPTTLLPISSVKVPGLKHLPWAAIHQEAGQPAVLYSSESKNEAGQPAVLYSSESKNVTAIMRHEYPSMAPLPSIPLTETIHSVQVLGMQSRVG
ncbi:hypothetical protein T484DRAFT_1829270 [Baffinella frigidus]|nr:hypothetical protein T484DRAFT_1829270 [Cryptophyta sp. CCMP2293]